MVELKLEVGGVYKKASGQIVRIVKVKEETEKGDTVYLDEASYLYLPNGEVFHALLEYGPIISCIRKADFKIQFGETYVTQEKNVTKIVAARDERGVLKFTGLNGQTYGEDGEFLEGAENLNTDSSRIISVASEKHINAARLNDMLRPYGYHTSKIFDEIRIWGEKTFGEVSPKRIIERAKEELDGELLPLLAEKDEWTPESLEEVADIFLILTRAPGLWEAIDRKIKINCDRDWNLLGDGTGYCADKGAET